MADETTSTTTQYSLPPEYIQQFLAGGGAGVPGLFPLLNASMYNQFATMGDPGATPYTYGGERIAGFTPRETEAFRLSDQAIGSYLPFLQKQESLYGQGLTAARTGAEQEADYAQRGADIGLAGTQEAANRLRGGYGLLGEQLGQSRDMLGLAGRTALGATRGYDPTGYNAYMSPYTDEVVGRTMGDMREQLEQQKAGARDRAVGAGAFGGSRGRIAEGDIERGGVRSMGDVAAGLRERGYLTAQQQAQGAFEQQQRRQAGAASQLGNIAGGLGSLAGQQATAGQNVATGIAGLGIQGAGLMGGLGQQLGGIGSRLAGQYQGFGGNYGQMGAALPQFQRQDIGLLGSVGGAQRNMNQGINDLAYRNFVGQYYMPQQLLGQYSAIGQGIAPLAGGTGVQTQSQPGMDYMTSALGDFWSTLGGQT